MSSTTLPLPKEIESSLISQPKYKQFQGGARVVIFKGKAEDSEFLAQMSANTVNERIKMRTMGKQIIIVEVSIEGYSPETLGGKAWFFFEEGTLVLLDVSYSI